MTPDVSLLKEVPLFKLLDDTERAMLAAQLDVVEFRKGERVFSVGDPGGAIFLVSAGLVELSLEVSTGEVIVLERVEPGDFFGEMSLLDGDPRSADATALEDTRALRIDRNDLRYLFSKQPDAALDLLTAMGRRLREADAILRTRPSASPNQEVAEQATVLQRVADALAAFSGSIPFLIFHVLWFAVWIPTNMGWIHWIHAFDPFPFGLLTMIVSLEAIFLSCFVLISQNRQAAKDRIRSDVEYAANIRAGLEVTQLHVKLDRLNEQMQARFAGVEQHLSRTG
jgi:uncharacterized membrane protein